MEKESIQYPKSENNADDVIDLRALFSLIVRNKILIGTEGAFLVLPLVKTLFLFDVLEEGNL